MDVTEEPIVGPESPEEQQEAEERPNVAISNAVARRGQYYVLQPNGLLQRVTYRTSANPKDKDSPVISNLKYENVKPIRDPIYTYQNGQLVRIN